MDFELDFSSENSTMTSFLELEQEIREAPLLSEPLVRPSVIVKPRHKPTVQPSLSDIMDSCGIEYDLPGDCNANISSPSSIHSDVQLEQNRELIDELEEFFINTDSHSKAFLAWSILRTSSCQCLVPCWCRHMPTLMS